MEGSHLRCGNGPVLSTGVGGLLPPHSLPYLTPTKPHSTYLIAPSSPHPAFWMQLQDGRKTRRSGWVQSEGKPELTNRNKHKWCNIGRECLVVLFRQIQCVDWEEHNCYMILTFCSLICFLSLTICSKCVGRNLGDNTQNHTWCPHSPGQLLPDDPQQLAVTGHLHHT